MNSIEEIVKEFESLCFIAEENGGFLAFNTGREIIRAQKDWLRTTLTTHNKALVEKLERITKSDVCWSGCCNKHLAALDQVIAEINKTYGV